MRDVRAAKADLVRSESYPKDFSNKAVVVMLITVIVVTLATLILYLNALDNVASGIRQVPSAQVQAQQAPPSQPISQGVVGLTIVSPENSDGGKP